MSNIFDEARMLRAIEKYIPDGETFVAGIHAGANESSVTGVFSGCILMQDRLRPDPNGGTVKVIRKKYSGYDVYLGITQNFLIIADCDTYDHYYQCDEKPEVGDAEIQKVTDDILLKEFGRRYFLTDIQRCVIKKGWLGSVKCFITMKNGNYFKLMFPKLGGLGNGMPHHAQYRDAIIERLSKYGA